MPAEMKIELVRSPVTFFSRSQNALIFARRFEPAPSQHGGGTFLINYLICSSLSRTFARPVTRQMRHEGVHGRGEEAAISSDLQVQSNHQQPPAQLLHHGPLSTIGHTVQDVIKSGEPKWLEFAMCPDVPCPSDAQLALYGQRFMSFFGAYPGAFRSLTGLTLRNLAFQGSDVTNLLNTCSKLKMLSLRSCEMPQESVLELDAPSSELSSLELKCFGCIHVQLICLPKLRELVYDVWFCENPPVSFGYLPRLDHVCFACPAQPWQKPFVLSQCLSSDINLSNLLLNFYTQMIWVEPEGPQQLTPIFSKLRDVHLCGIFTECDLDWTMFILEGAPSLENFHLSRHSCEFSKSEDDAEKTNLVRQASNFKHLKLKLLVMKGFEEEYKVMNYIRLVMERAVCLKRIELLAKSPCKKCTVISPRFPVDEASKHRIREQLRYGLSSSADIIIG